MHSLVLVFLFLCAFICVSFSYPIGSGGCFQPSSINDDFKAFIGSHGLQSTTTASFYRIVSSSPLLQNDALSPSRVSPTSAYAVQWNGRCPLRISVCSSNTKNDDHEYRGVLISSTVPIVTADRNLRPLPCHSSPSTHPSSHSSHHQPKRGEGGSGTEANGGMGAWGRGRGSYGGSGGAPAIATSAEGLPVPNFAFTHYNSHPKLTPIEFTVASLQENASNQTIVIIVLDGKKGEWVYWSIKTVLPSSDSEEAACPSLTESLCPFERSKAKKMETVSMSDGNALKLILFNRNANSGEKMKSDEMGNMNMGGMDMDHSMHSSDDNKNADQRMENCADCAKKGADKASNNDATPAPKSGCPHCAAAAAAKASATPPPASPPKSGCPHCAHSASSSDTSDHSSGHAAHSGGGGCPHCSKSSSSSSSDDSMHMPMDGSMSMGGMTMVFTTNWRGNELLFPGWRTDNLFQYIIQLIIIFFFAFGYEFLQSFQADWDVKTAIKNAKSAHHYTAIGAIGEDDEEKVSGNPVTSELVWVPYEWSQQIVRATIYGIRVFLSLLIMMVFMTMDIGLVIAIMLGYFGGFMIFSRHRVAPQKTACH